MEPASGDTRILDTVSAIDFEELLASSPNPYVLFDRDYAIVWMNEAYLTVTMRDREEIIGRNLFEAFPSEGESFRKLNGSLRRVIETGKSDEIAHIRYDIANPDGTYDTHYWSATHTPLCNPDGSVAYILQHTVNITELEELRRLRDTAGVVERARSVEKRYQSAADELVRVKNLIEQAPGFVAVLTGPEHRFLLANAAYRSLLGNRELVGRTVSEAIPEIVEQGFVDTLDKVMNTGRPYFGNRELVALTQPDTGARQEFHLEFIFQPISEPSGDVTGVFVQGYDVTEEVEAQDRQKLLINELNHRVKNTLAIVQSLAQQSFGKLGERAGLDIFLARLAALASAHNLLTDCNWKMADLETIVQQSLAATAGSDTTRYSVEGPIVTLHPQEAVALAMIIHELATNALKYGALSNDKGRVAIDWELHEADGSPRLILDWRESGGPPVEQPDQPGFGSRLISRGFGNRDDRVSLEYNRDGLHCHLEASP
ncbi:PAS domain-containing protein [Erythrobacter sp.]|uniref:sensor histidine kinase n=1 Tax=Erythrobacter sp. TaxID=1042 RepID=UPI0025BDEE0C|nr:PAS domain-containing protein [Erythrobacter sp.]